MESCVGKCKMKMEAIRVNKPAEFKRPGVKRGGENGGGMRKELIGSLVTAEGRRTKTRRV